MSSALKDLTPEQRDDYVLMVLRAHGPNGYELNDCYDEGYVRACLRSSLIPRGLARIEGKPSEARAFITAKGLAFSVGERAAA